MVKSWTIPAMASPSIPKLGQGVVFQTLDENEQFPVLSFSMTVPDYLRRRLRKLVRIKFSF